MSRSVSTRPRGASRFARRVAVLAAAAGLAVLATACGSGSGGLTAVQLGKPEAIPAQTFTDTAGQPYDLQQQAKGKLTLVYFGYTNCPDVCPTTMADIGTALRSLPASTQKKVQVVFVTSDPGRDTPPKIRAWLDHFDQGLANPFVGLRTTVPAVDAFGQKLGIPLEPPVIKQDGTEDVYEVTHGAAVLIFAPKTATADYTWLPGATAQQYAHDIKHFVSS
ncbi:MAG TPA: SCO family protein [Mycobacteriales bacterium]